MEDIKAVSYIRTIESNIIAETEYCKHEITMVPEKFEKDDFYNLQLITRICDYFEDLDMQTSYSSTGLTIYW